MNVVTSRRHLIIIWVYGRQVPYYCIILHTRVSALKFIRRFSLDEKSMFCWKIKYQSWNMQTIAFRFSYFDRKKIAPCFNRLHLMHSNPNEWIDARDCSHISLVVVSTHTYVFDVRQHILPDLFAVIHLNDTVVLLVNENGLSES